MIASSTTMPIAIVSASRVKLLIEKPRKYMMANVATIDAGLAIPASIVATFAIMYFLGFSINNFTLLALTIAIGIVVDDAIIVLENAYRHQEELHEEPEVAAVN